MSLPPAESVTAVVCTRDRAEGLVHTIRTILASDHPDFDLVIVDQSSNDETAEAVAPFLGSSRVRYVRSESKGLGLAHNIALAHARSEVVAITDDDCEVPPDWLSKMAAVLAENPRVAVAFCDVDAAPCDTSKGFIPAYRCDGNRRLRRIRDKCGARGIGAGMAVRRSAVQRMGGFDESLGPGAVFPSCDDGDIAVRALLGGCEVLETSDVSVLHFGFRTWKEGRELALRNWYAIGAVHAKPLKAGRWSFWPVAAHEFLVHAAWPPVARLLQLRSPRPLTPVSAFLRGFVRGWLTPVDTATLCFRAPRSGTAEPSAGERRAATGRA